MTDDAARDQHPLDPDPPRPPGVPDLNLDLPIGEGAPSKPAGSDETPVDKEETETPD